VGIFRQVLEEVVKKFQPNAIVLQCGADSLSGDSVGIENGSFNLSTKGHSDCVRLIRDLGLPLVVLGGGGYSKSSVAKCWAIETAILCDAENKLAGNVVPISDHYYSQHTDKHLHVPARKDAVNFNSPGRVKQILQAVFGNIQKLKKFSKNGKSTLSS
jgi:histone deacetylase 1/2